MIDVVAAVIKKNNLYFIAQRNRNKYFAYYWEFPGGKVDNQETFKNALKSPFIRRNYRNTYGKYKKDIG